MTRLSTTIDALTRQLARHGYFVTPEEARDIASNLLMAIDATETETRTENDSSAMWRPSDGKLVAL